MVDFTVLLGGSILILTPHNDNAAKFLAERLDDGGEHLAWGSGVVVEPRYIEAIVLDLQDNGFTVGDK